MKKKEISNYKNFKKYLNHIKIGRNEAKRPKGCNFVF